jgi:hypothetical protein
LHTDHPRFVTLIELTECKYGLRDLDSVWRLPLLDLLRDRERGIVYVFGDANQDLYHAREPDELGVVTAERPPVYFLNAQRSPRNPPGRVRRRRAGRGVAVPADAGVRTGGSRAAAPCARSQFVKEGQCGVVAR